MRAHPLTITDYYCPACGAKTVLVDELSDDYYCGCAHICQTCRATFHLPGGVSAANSKAIEELKAALTEKHGSQQK